MPCLFRSYSTIFHHIHIIKHQLTTCSFFYPETAGRSLEEIDLIFAKGFLEKKNYVQAAKELPKIADHEVDQRAREFGFVSSDDESPVAKDRQSRDVEKQEGINTNPGGLAA
jgi:hypothetical protein